MVVFNSVSKRIDSDPDFYKVAQMTRRQFDLLCLSKGLSPLDVAEWLYEETGYNWRK